MQQDMTTPATRTSLGIACGLGAALIWGAWPVITTMGVKAEMTPVQVVMLRFIVAGIILTNDIEPHPKLRELLTQTNIPVMTAAGESFTVTSKIHGMTVKTQPGDSDKIPVIKRLIQEHVGIDNLLEAIKPRP